MSITEQPLAENVASNLTGAAAEGAGLAGVALDAPPQKIVESLNTYVADSLNNSANEVDNCTDRALPLGCLWAAQLIREFGWEWATVVRHDENNFKATGVFDGKRSLAIYPFHYVYGCLENRVCPTILLAFNMLKAGKIPALPPGAYMNLMDGVRHIVPPL